MAQQETIVATRIADCVVIAVPDDLAGQRLAGIEEAAQRCTTSHSLRAMVFDLSALKFADTTEFRGLLAIADAIAILGVRPLLVGLNPGIIMHLVDSGLDTGPVQAYLDLGDALTALGLAFVGDRA